jgi:hypothetical protein
MLIKNASPCCKDGLFVEVQSSSSIYMQQQKKNHLLIMEPFFLLGDVFDEAPQGMK